MTMTTPRRRKHDEVSLETLDLRVMALEDGFEQMRDDIGGARREILANTRLVEEIHGNTADIVEVMSDLKVLFKWGKRLAKPAAYVFALGASAYVYLKTNKWVWP